MVYIYNIPSLTAQQNHRTVKMDCGYRENSYIFTGELRQRAIIAGLVINILPPVFTRPDFQPQSTQQILNDTRRYVLYMHPQYAIYTGNSKVMIMTHTVSN